MNGLEVRLGAPVAAMFIAVLLVLSACGPASGSGGSSTVPSVTPLVMASTTSTQDSGLFDVLIPAFEDAYPQYDVKVIAVGTGEALKLGETQDADVVLVHSKADEEEFVAEGFGVERRDVMYNDFVIVGPESDPAKTGAAASAADAFSAIAKGEAPFISRSDDSGTNKKEIALWKSAAVELQGDWYQQAGQGMGEVLKIASEKQGYTLSDRATYLAMRDALDLVVTYEKSDDLLNQYGVIPVSDATNAAGAAAFTEWVTSSEGQSVIEQYGVDKYGEPLFVPNAQ